jgi:hypothetical protein
MNNEKTSIGIPVGLMGAALYFTILVGGQTPFLLLAAYVFFFEKSDWLKRTAVKAYALDVVLAIAYYLLGIVPDLTSMIGDIISIFDSGSYHSFSIPFISPLVSVLRDCVNIVEKVFFILLGFSAMKKSDIAIAAIDKIADQVTGVVSNAAAKVVSTVKKEEPKAEENKAE